MFSKKLLFIWTIDSFLINFLSLKISDTLMEISSYWLEYVSEPIIFYNIKIAKSQALICWPDFTIFRVEKILAYNNFGISFYHISWVLNIYFL